MDDITGLNTALSLERTPGERKALAAMVAVGDEGARDLLVQSMVGLALSIAGRFAKQSPVDVTEELESEALEWLVRSVDSYNPEHGVPIHTWAGLCIRRRLSRKVSAEVVQRRRFKLTGGTGPAGTGHAPSVDPRHDVDIRDLERMLLAAELEPEVRHAVCRRAQGAHLKDIATELNMSRRTLGRKLRTAMELLEELCN